MTEGYKGLVHLGAFGLFTAMTLYNFGECAWEAKQVVGHLSK